jgi:general stress protein 26
MKNYQFHFFREVAMKERLNEIVIFLLFLLLLPGASILAQTDQFPKQRELPGDSLLIYARIIVDSSNSRVLVTVDETGKPRARTMSPFTPEEDWTIWLGTFPTSRKVKQIKSNPNVVVFYYDVESYSYVNVTGTARLVNDPDLKAKYWKEGWKRFYPDREKDYVLIEVTPQRIEVCSFKYDLLWDEEGIPPSVDFGTTGSE